MTKLFLEPMVMWFQEEQKVDVVHTAHCLKIINEGNPHGKLSRRACKCLQEM